MQTLLSQEEKNELVRFFKDLDWLFDHEIGVEEYSSEMDIRETLLKADTAKLAESLVDAV